MWIDNMILLKMSSHYVLFWICYWISSEPLRDDALDNKFGVQCDNGRFKQPERWPKEAECEVKNTCNGAQ